MASSSLPEPARARSHAGSPAKPLSPNLPPVREDRGHNVRKPPRTNPRGLLKRNGRQSPTLPQGLPCSTIGAKELNFRVRNGNGCVLSAIITDQNIVIHTLAYEKVRTGMGSTLYLFS
jgi:hypothetical protein